MLDGLPGGFLIEMVKTITNPFIIGSLTQIMILLCKSLQIVYILRPNTEGTMINILYQLMLNKEKEQKCGESCLRDP